LKQLLKTGANTSQLGCRADLFVMAKATIDHFFIIVKIIPKRK
jgi:hypothetical protein